jgi:carboxyl-terminal processing protease
MALDASGTFTSFATAYIQKHPITANFQVSASDLEDFQVYASERSIQPSVGEWVKERPWVQSRLKQEIFNQALGVAKGDEVEAQRDPVVQAAIQKLVP